MGGTPGGGGFGLWEGKIRNRRCNGFNGAGRPSQIKPTENHFPLGAPPARRNELSFFFPEEGAGSGWSLPSRGGLLWDYQGGGVVRSGGAASVAAPSSGAAQQGARDGRRGPEGAEAAQSRAQGAAAAAVRPFGANRPPSPAAVSPATPPAGAPVPVASQPARGPPVPVAPRPGPR